MAPGRLLTPKDRKISTNRILRAVNVHGALKLILSFLLFELPLAGG